MARERIIAEDWSPNWAVHPGDVLEEHLEARELTQADFARRAGLTPKLVSTIVAGKNPITADTALAIERVLGVKAYIWTGLQSAWDLHQTREAQREAASEPSVRDWIAKFPIKELQALGILPKSDDTGAHYDSLLKFFGVGSVNGYHARFDRLSVQYRHSVAHQSEVACLHAWLQIGELKARDLPLKPFSADRFASALKTVRTLTRESPAMFFPKMVDECAHAGVAVVAVRPLPKTRLSGAARWLSSDRAIIQLSLRHKTNDHFWFSFFHEAGHVALHKHDIVFADDEGGKGDGAESEADAFAEETLVGRQRFADFSRTHPKARHEVIQFADRVEIHPGIVVGMLQHHGILPWAHLNDLKEKFVWSEDA